MNVLTRAVDCVLKLKEHFVFTKVKLINLVVHIPNCQLDKFLFKLLACFLLLNLSCFMRRFQCFGPIYKFWTMLIQTQTHSTSERGGSGGRLKHQNP